MSAGKGDKRRPGKPGAYERGYEAIDWSKGRKPAARKADLGRVLIAGGEGVEWVIPPLEDLLGPTLDEIVRRHQEDDK